MAGLGPDRTLFILLFLPPSLLLLLLLSLLLDFHLCGLSCHFVHYFLFLLVLLLLVLLLTKPLHRLRLCLLQLPLLLLLLNCRLALPAKRDLQLPLLLLNIVRIFPHPHRHEMNLQRPPRLIRDPRLLKIFVNNLKPVARALLSASHQSLHGSVLVDYAQGTSDLYVGSVHYLKLDVVRYVVRVHEEFRVSLSLSHSIPCHVD
mmetsp:Transcript_9312/g.16877  ORF Transcript_9312/g.16877 Transcript_9312/m.16877 type:complete len:203 (-) Transcript_9312:1802-2410(-)